MNSSVPVTDWLALGVLSLCLSGLFYNLISSWYTWLYFRDRHPSKPQGCTYPPISILKPVYKNSPELLENLSSFCNQDYPEYEIIFVAADPEDPGVQAIRDLMEKGNLSNAQLIFASGNTGPNYKIGNLMAALKEARHEVIVISDADMRVNNQYLKQVVRTLEQNGVGLVTCLYRSSGFDHLSGVLESLFVQGDFIPGVIMAKRLEGISFAFGSTLALTQETLNRAGGLEALKSYLADDYHLGNRIRKLGLTVEILPYLIEHRSSARRFRDFWHHQLRWEITIRVSRPWGHGASVLTHSITPAVLYLILQHFSVTGWTVLSGLILARLTTFYLVNKLVIHDSGITRYMWLLPFKDLLATVIWGMSMITRKVFWGGRTYKVHTDGTFVEDPPDITRCP
jgi:ceramide glucosyltransferase